MSESLHQNLWQGVPVMVNAVFDPPEVLLAFLNMVTSTYL